MLAWISKPGFQCVCVAFLWKLCTTTPGTVAQEERNCWNRVRQICQPVGINLTADDTVDPQETMNTTTLCLTTSNWEGFCQDKDDNIVFCDNKGCSALGINATDTTMCIEANGMETVTEISGTPELHVFAAISSSIPAMTYTVPLSTSNSKSSRLTDSDSFAPTTVCRTYNQTTIQAERLKEMSSSIAKQLTVTTKNLSKSIRKKTSAPDSRPSSQSIGYIALCLICVPFIGIVLVDMGRIIADIRNAFLNVKGIGDRPRKIITIRETEYRNS